MATNL